MIFVVIRRNRVTRENHPEVELARVDCRCANTGVGVDAADDDMRDALRVEQLGQRRFEESAAAMLDDRLI